MSIYLGLALKTLLKVYDNIGLLVLQVIYVHIDIILCIIGGELLVIEEFCRYGNLRDYLIKNRQHYVNELDSWGDLLLIPPEEVNELLSIGIKEN